MKRASGLIIIIAVCMVGFLSIRGMMPFMPVIGASMEPALQSGSLLTIDSINPEDVEVGDIIVYNAPSLVREHYGYPLVVAHRVIKVNTEPGLSFRTAGDSAGEDPFAVRPQDLRGTVGSHIPYLGLPLLFLQSQHGLIFTIVALILLAFFLYGSEISRGWNTLHRRIFSPVINEEKRSNWVISRKIEATEQKMAATEQALSKFATAIANYAEHLASHTSAIQGLNEASHELKRGAAEQNRVLMRFVENIEPPGARREKPAWKIEPPLPEPKKPAPSVEEPVTRLVHKIPEERKVQFPPGCARNRQTSTTEAHATWIPDTETHTSRVYATRPPVAEPRPPRGRQALVVEALAAEREILGAIKQLNNRLSDSSF